MERACLIGDALSIAEGCEGEKNDHFLLVVSFFLGEMFNYIFSVNKQQLQGNRSS